MTSFRQIEANQRNALRSTGPRTEDGKRRSRQNAVRHGLTSETIIVALEDIEDYQAFEVAVIADYEYWVALFGGWPGHLSALRRALYFPLLRLLGWNPSFQPKFRFR
jgi:hypothetical protein